MPRRYFMGVPEDMFVCQLGKREQLRWYKAIKAKLVAEGAYSYENLRHAMENKIVDLEGLV